MLMFWIWPFDKRIGIIHLRFHYCIGEIISIFFILSLICPSCNTIHFLNFIGKNPCEHSLLTGTNRKVTDPSGDM